MNVSMYTPLQKYIKSGNLAMASREMFSVILVTCYDGAAHITRLLRQFQAAEAKTEEVVLSGHTAFWQEV